MHAPLGSQEEGKTLYHGLLGPAALPLPSNPALPPPCIPRSSLSTALCPTALGHVSFKWNFRAHMVFNSTHRASSMSTIVILTLDSPCSLLLRSVSIVPFAWNVLSFTVLLIPFYLSFNVTFMGSLLGYLRQARPSSRLHLVTGYLSSITFITSAASPRMLASGIVYTCSPSHGGLLFALCLIPSIWPTDGLLAGS